MEIPQYMVQFREGETRNCGYLISFIDYATRYFRRTEDKATLHINPYLDDRASKPMSQYGVPSQEQLDFGYYHMTHINPTTRIF